MNTQTARWGAYFAWTWIVRKSRISNAGSKSSRSSASDEKYSRVPREVSRHFPDPPNWGSCSLKHSDR